jgi:hypothetical protein
MSYHKQESIVEKNFRRALEAGGSDLLEAINQLISARPGIRVGDTTVTAYRRIHEVLGSFLDFATRVASKDEQWNRAFGKLSVELARARIIVNYQLARNQISFDIASLLNAILDALENELRKKSRERVREVAENGRTLLDALAVFVYMHGKKR